MADNPAHPHNRRRVLTIDDLPDDVLLEIFAFYVVQYQDLLDLHQLFDRHSRKKIEPWKSLVRVCPRWKDLVFGSPRRLNLQICCGPRFTTKPLDVWPPFPVAIKGDVTKELVDNVIPSLGHRICQINLRFYDTRASQVKKLWTQMQAPFPELAGLYLSFEGDFFSFVPGPVLPDSFLGGSAPRLRYLALKNIVFPGLPKLLSSAPHLVKLHLHHILHPAFVSPEAMATCLPTLTGLESLHLGFEWSHFRPNRESRRLFPSTRNVLPSLKKFQFIGVIEYFEEFVAQIDAPQLYRLSTTFLNNIDFGTAELNQFISRTPSFGTFNEAGFIFDECKVLLRLCQSHSEPSDRELVEVEVLSHRQLSSSTLAQICHLSLRPVLTIENLYIYEVRDSHISWKDDIEDTEWLDLLLPFTAVKNLYVSKQFAPCIAPALQETTRTGTTEVLSTLQDIYLEGFQQYLYFQPTSVDEAFEDIERFRRFISARQLTNPSHPVAISDWYRNSHWDY